MKIYTTPNEFYVEGKGWIKPENFENEDSNNLKVINYNYLEIIFINEKTGLIDGMTGKEHITRGQEDIPVERSRECLYKDGCRIHRLEFFPK